MILAEECRWRRAQGGRRARKWWYTDRIEMHAPLLKGARLPEPSELTGIYRRLRKGREDAKNEPGAADFYYGECEMRRHDYHLSATERAILTMYWLISGYGLRSLRALGWLAALLLVAGFLLWQVGFPESIDPPLWASVLYAAQSVISMDSKLNGFGRDVTLTGPGEAIRLTMRLAGPVLLGLALLAVRNRVKR
jgi:hypothetical protein